MSRCLCWAVAVLIYAPSAYSQQQQIADMRSMLSGTMRPDVEVRTFEHSDLLYPVNTVRRGVFVRPLYPAARRLNNVVFEQNGKRHDLFEYLSVNRVAALLVMKDGKVALEDYELGVGPTTRWASFSMTKSVTSTLIGIALEDGAITSLEDPVTRYVPLLNGSVYENVSIRNLLKMASGVQWDETYTNPASDCGRLTEAQLTHRPGASMAYMSHLSRAAPPGSAWNYNSGETNIAGAIVEGATRKSLSAYLSEKLWSQLGMDGDATWWTESPGGMGLGGVGLSATLRDYGRFGLFALRGGILDGRQLVPAGWFGEAGAAHTIGEKKVDYGYQWWPTPVGDPIHDGSFEAKGIFGQHLYVNPKEQLVIVVLSARPKPTGSTVLDDGLFFAAVARTLH